MSKTMQKKNTKVPVTQIQPLGDRVVVQVSLDKEQKTSSGLILPDSVKQEKPGQGVVVAVGPGRRLDSGEIVPMQVSIGDTVLFSKYAPDEVEIESQNYLVVREDSLLAIIK